jgi:hypothetical protein
MNLEWARPCHNWRMKTDLNTAGSLPQSKAPGALSEREKLPLSVKQEMKQADSSPDYKVELSSKLPGSPSVAPRLPELPRPKLEEVVKSGPKEEAIKAAAEVVAEAKPGSAKRAAIIFIKGLDLFSSPSKSERGYAGVGRLADSVEGSRIYGWDQKDEIIKEILKVHPDYPVVLVGHSMGGDTAMEIAEELDSLEHKFRSVDLLVTLDSVGFSNDIVPQNVKHHLNVFGEGDLLLNDGPHVARRHEKTTVQNILSALDHTDIDDSKEVQYEVVNMIQKTLGKIS